MNRVIDEFTREEYELLYSAFKSFRVYMNDGNQPLPVEIPNNGSLEEIITHFAFKIVN